jgi:hypothetical protein
VAILVSEELRATAGSRWAKLRNFGHNLKTKTKRALWRSKDGWRQLTAGMEAEDLWTQFKAEAQASSQLYKQDVDWRAVGSQKAWKQPFKIVAALFAGILKKLSPARRVLLVFSMILACLSVIGVQFLVITTQVEFLLAFAGLLILLIMVLGDHVAMKRDIEIAREIQRWLVPRVPPEVPGIDMAFATRPANTVAGDYYDAFRRAADGPLLIAVADVSGKSVPAAMLMANFQASLRARFLIAIGHGPKSACLRQQSERPPLHYRVPGRIGSRNGRTQLSFRWPQPAHARAAGRQH